MDDKSEQMVGILGAGWLGSALAERLLAAGYPVCLSHRSDDKVFASRQHSAARVFRVDLPGELPPEFIQPLHYLVVTLPPGGRRLGPGAADVYLARLRPVLSASLAHDQLRVIFCSSTGVYGAGHGMVDETAPLRPETNSARAVVAAERLLASLGNRLTIVRLAGLVGPGRHPGTFFGRKSLPVRQSDAPVNLVHQSDAAAAIQLLIERGAPGGVYNVCAAAHPPKGAFYGAAAGAVGLEVGAVEGGGGQGKIIGSNPLRQLGWRPRYDDLRIFLEPESDRADDSTS